MCLYSSCMCKLWLYGCMFMYCYVHVLDSPMCCIMDYIHDVYIKGGTMIRDSIQRGYVVGVCMIYGHIQGRYI